MPSFEPPAADLAFDEVGRATIRLGAHTLQSAFLPVYRVAGQDLVPSAFRAVAVVTDGSGRIIEDAPEARLAQHFARPMHHANLAHRDGDDLAYIERWIGAPAEAYEGLAELILAAAITEFDSNRLVWEVEAGEISALQPALEQARRLNVTTCLRLDGFHAISSSNLPDDVPVDLVCLEPFREGAFATGGPDAERLLRMAATHFRSRDTKIIVSGIETPEQMKMALEAGANQVEGPLFGPPVIAGRRAGWQRVDTRVPLAARSKVIAFPG